MVRRRLSEAILYVVRDPTPIANVRIIQLPLGGGRDQLTDISRGPRRRSFRVFTHPGVVLAPRIASELQYAVSRIYSIRDEDDELVFGLIGSSERFQALRILQSNKRALILLKAFKLRNVWW